MSFDRNLPNKYGKQSLDTAAKTGIVALKTATKNVVHKAAEATGEYIGNKIADKTVKSKPVTDENSRRNIGEIMVPPEKREKILSE